MHSLLDLRFRPRANNKVLYYARATFRELIPAAYFRFLRDRCLRTVERYPRSEIFDRVDYYNQVPGGFSLSDSASRIKDISFKNSMHFFDLREFARYYDPELRLDYLFGDVKFVPATPTIVKSRPISTDNANAVVMKLGYNRHYFFPTDPYRFADKLPKAVWRGTPNNRLRTTLVHRYHAHPLCDVGQTRRGLPNLAWKPFMPVSGQLRYRYVLSVEGNDVATNLKWIMASNSLCLMPAPRMETWFMEGRLVPGHHYVQLRNDFADLEENILHYEQNPEEAGAIIANANAYAAQFRDYDRERLISLLVLAKYFRRSGQLAGAG